MFLYVKALHVIFVITWFSGLFYIVRLFVYNAEAEEKPEEEKRILHPQFNKMMKGLWYGITWPSAILTLIFGSCTWYMFGITPSWLTVKLCFVFGLYLYHFSLHYIFKQQMRGEFKWTSQQLRIWNEVATIFLVVIVMLVIVQNNLSVLWGLIGFVLFAIALMSVIKIYKVLRIRKEVITLAPYDKTEALRPFIDNFWETIFETSYSTSFVSNESLFRSWEHYLQGGKEELIDKVNKHYNYDISSIYNKPIHEILTVIKNSISSVQAKK